MRNEMEMKETLFAIQSWRLGSLFSPRQRTNMYVQVPLDRLAVGASFFTAPVSFFSVTTALPLRLEHARREKGRVSCTPSRPPWPRFFSTPPSQLVGLQVKDLAFGLQLQGLQTPPPPGQVYPTLFTVSRPVLNKSQASPSLHCSRMFTRPNVPSCPRLSSTRSFT